MARICWVCGKRPVSGNRVSHAGNRNRRRWVPNLQKIRIKTSRGIKRVWICTRCLRSGKVEKEVRIPATVSES